MNGKELIKEFEQMRNVSELRALSNVSLDRPLTDKEFNELMELKNKYLKVKKWNK